MATRNEHERTLLTVFQKVLAKCSDKEVARLSEVRGTLEDRINWDVIQLSRPPAAPTPKPTHKDICIRFSAETEIYIGEYCDDYFEAVGFLGDDEDSCSVDEMLARTAGTHGGAVSDNYYTLIERATIKCSLDLKKYVLVTNSRAPDRPDLLRCFIWDGWVWKKHVCSVNDLQSYRHLVIRHFVWISA